MGRVIAIASQKGGVGKTTTTINLGACLAEEGQKVLIIDVDPQGNASSGLGINGNDQKVGIYEALIDSADPADGVVPTPMSGLEILTAGQRLSGAEVELVGMMARETRLRGVIAPLRDLFDYILIDCPPSLGLLTVNALTAADSVLIPLQCEYLALEGLTQLIAAIRLVQDHLNPALRIEGVLLTMYDVRLNLAQQVVEEARKFFSDRVYKTIIPRSVRLGEAPSFGKPIILYDPHSTGAQKYRDLAQEITGRADVKRTGASAAGHRAELRTESQADRADSDDLGEVDEVDVRVHESAVSRKPPSAPEVVPETHVYVEESTSGSSGSDGPATGPEAPVYVGESPAEDGSTEERADAAEVHDHSTASSSPGGS